MSSKKPRESIPEGEQGYLGIIARNIDSQTAQSFDMPEGIFVYEIADKEYEKRFCGKPVDMVEDNVGISLRYVSRQTIPLVIYSYLINYADKRRFFEDTANYVHILADANI